MDLQVYAVIVIVFLVSLCTLLFVNKQLRGGKTYEEVVAEKRLLAEKLYGSKRKNTKKNVTGKKVKETDSSRPLLRDINCVRFSDGQESRAQAVGEVVQAAAGRGRERPEVGQWLRQRCRQQQRRRFSEIARGVHRGRDHRPRDQHRDVQGPYTASSDCSLQSLQHFPFPQRQLSTGKINVAAVRKSSATKPPGASILMNKNANTARTNVVNVNGAVESLNHFDQIQPKDDLEIKKQRDESLSRNRSLSSGPGSNKKEKKANKHQAKKDASPTAAAENSATVVDAVESHLIVPLEAVASATAAPKESPKNAPKDNKSNKKRRNDALVQQLGKSHDLRPLPQPNLSGVFQLMPESLQTVRMRSALTGS